MAGNESNPDIWGQQIPIEVLCLIFKFVVDAEGSVPFLICAKKVCKRWNSAADLSSLWYDLDFSPGNIRIKSLLKKDLLVHSEKFISTKRLCLANRNELLKQRVLSSLLELFPNLEYLDLTNNKYIKPADLMQAVVFYGDQLTGLNLSGTACDNATYKKILLAVGKNLRSLDLSYSVKFSGNLYSVIHKRCHFLEELNLSSNNPSGFFSIREFQAGCPLLKSLSLCNIYLEVGKNFMKQDSKGFVQLEEVNLSTNLSPFYTVNDTTLRALLADSTKLRVLMLRGIKSITASSLVDLPCADLTHLDISLSEVIHNAESSEMMVEVLGRYASSLIWLDLSWCGNLDFLLKTWVDSAVLSLKHLDLAGSTVSCSTLLALLDNCCLGTLNLTSIRNLPRGVKRQYNEKELHSLYHRLRLQLDLDGDIEPINYSATV